MTVGHRLKISSRLLKPWTDPDAMTGRCSMVSSGYYARVPSGVIYLNDMAPGLPPMNIFASSADGTFEAILARLQLRLREDGLMDLDTRMIDATSVRATRAAAGGTKKGARKNRKIIRLAVAAVASPPKFTWYVTGTAGLAFALSPGQQADSHHFISTLERIHLLGRTGRPHKRSRYIVADKGYDSDELRRYCDRHGMKPVIAQRNRH